MRKRCGEKIRTNWCNRVPLHHLFNERSIFIKVNEWGKFKQSYIERNKILEALSVTTVPEIVTILSESWRENHVYTPCVVSLTFSSAVDLEGQCRCMLQMSTFLDHILSLPRTRST